MAVGAVADMAIGPHSAMMIGALAGVISTFGFRHFTPQLNPFVHDTCMYKMLQTFLKPKRRLKKLKTIKRRSE